MIRAHGHGVRGRPAPAAVTVVVAVLPGRAGRWRGDPRVVQPLRDPRCWDQSVSTKHTTEISQGDGWGRARPCRPHPALRGEGVGRTGLSPARSGPWRRGRGRQQRRACTRAPPPGLARSAQDLVQVGRREEGVGSQAQGQEALDQGGAKTTLKRERRDPVKGAEARGGSCGGCLAEDHPSSSLAPRGLPPRRSRGPGALGQGLPL